MIGHWVHGMLLLIKAFTFFVEWTFPHANTYSVLFNLDRATAKDILLFLTDGKHFRAGGEEAATVSTHQICCGQGPVV